MMKNFMKPRFAFWLSWKSQLIAGYLRMAMSPSRTKLPQRSHLSSSELGASSGKSLLWLPVVSPPLQALSWLYGAVVRTRRTLYSMGLVQRSALPVPVISVGNLTWGGTGKTPMTEYLTYYLAKHKKQFPIILTRGYGDDEWKQLEAHCKNFAKIGVGADRYTTAINILKQFPESITTHVAILDDGFQHLTLHRDVDIIMINCLNPFGSGYLIPRGNLREPLTALRGADVICLHHADLVEAQIVANIKIYLQRFCAESSIFATSRMVCRGLMSVSSLHKTMTEKVSNPATSFNPQSPSPNHHETPLILLSVLEGKRVLIMAAIGSNQSIVQLARQSGAKEVRTSPFLDHYSYQEEDFKYILQQKDGKDFDILLFTEKDYHRSASLLVKVEEKLRRDKPRTQMLVMMSSLQIVDGLDHIQSLLQERIERKMAPLST